ncbi:MAG: peptidase C15 [Beijerinckiaceae bacterium]
MPRILITGFGPFPGAPSNPTMAIVRHLVRSRHPRFAGVERLGRFLPTEWDMLPGFCETIRQCQPDAVLMFGLAGRRRTITPEARAINQASVLRVDAEGHRPSAPQLAHAGPRQLKSTIDPVRMSAAMRRAGLPAKVSQDAGDYLCNALLWTAIETGVPAIFVHVPRPRRMKRPVGTQVLERPAPGDLNRAGEAALASVLAGLTIKR